jgi:hypothetical protein
MRKMIGAMGAPLRLWPSRNVPQSATFRVLYLPSFAGSFPCNR